MSDKKEYKHGDRVFAVFDPKDLDTFNYEYVHLLGKKMLFSFGWIVDDGSKCDGQVAFIPEYDERSPFCPQKPIFGWCPEEDLKHITKLGESNV